MMLRGNSVFVYMSLINVSFFFVTFFQCLSLSDRIPLHAYELTKTDALLIGYILEGVVYT